MTTQAMQAIHLNAVEGQSKHDAKWCMPSGQPSGTAGAVGCTHPLGPASWDADAAESLTVPLRLAPAVISSPPQDAEIQGNCIQEPSVRQDAFST